MNILIEESDVKEIPILPLPEIEITTGRVIIPPALGRRPGTIDKTHLEKEIIALDANFSGLSQTEVARIHGVTQPEVSIHSRGVDRTNLDGQNVDKEIRTLINQTKHKIADRATTRLMESLDLFNPSALEQKDLPSAAMKMAGVVEKVTQGFEGDGNRLAVQFNIYAPRVRSEDSFQVIEVSE